MLELGSSGSVRGVLSNEHPYRHPATAFCTSRTFVGPILYGSKGPRAAVGGCRGEFLRRVE